MGANIGDTVRLVGADNSQAVYADNHNLRVSPRDPLLQAALEGRAYAWVNAAADIDVNDTILFLRNDSPTLNLHIWSVTLCNNAAGLISLALPVDPATAVTGTAVVGVPLNQSKKAVAPATCLADTANDTQANNIAILDVVADQAFTLEYRGAIILGYKDCIAAYATTEPTETQCVILGYFADLTN